MISTRPTPTSARWQDISPDAASGALGAFRIVDVRQPDEFHGDLGHIDGADLVPLPELASSISGWDLEAPLLIVCHSGRRAAAACDLLVGAGFTDVQNLKGGMVAWNAAGLPVNADRTRLGGQR